MEQRRRARFRHPRFELTREGDGARLVFTHKGMPYASSGLMLPGWHFYLARPGQPPRRGIAAAIEAELARAAGNLCRALPFA